MNTTFMPAFPIQKNKNSNGTFPTEANSGSKASTSGRSSTNHLTKKINSSLITYEVI
ncbi:unnamed protein product, partial [Vitis vinifera]|uniref:Uncharacterized protein n=1 Tax=Vitis vinifera TaxID=29760 RepID=E0CPR2_VITVI